MHTNYYIGCSGYYYTYWKNRFYPPGTPPKNWLAYYSTVFNTVELNGTFYRTPKLADLERYAAATPDKFTFSVKMGKHITHLAKLKDSKADIADFQALIKEGLDKKLDYFLFQLPPSFHYNPENMERILENIPNTKENVVELRHASWWNPEVQDALTQAGISFCNVDMPGLKTYFIHTTDVFYLRLHGNPELFKSPYSTSRLAELAAQFPAGNKQYNIYFNNTYYEAGYQNALELVEMIQTK